MTLPPGPNIIQLLHLLFTNFHTGFTHELQGTNPLAYYKRFYITAVKG
jgi:hypothetical protein